MKKNDRYTLITGASEGFGKSLAFECARRGMNLILVSLPGEELHRLGDYIQHEFGTKVICKEHDLSNKEDCISLYNYVLELNIKVNILINNAAMGGTHFFYERDAEHYHRQIELNVVAPTILTHLFLNDLEKNGPSHILNVSSLAGFFNLPTKQVYGGTKSYLLSFSRSLNTELKRKKIYVSTICPGGMNTNLAQQVQNNSLSGLSRWSVMNPEDVAKQAIDSMLKRKAVIIPGFWNRSLLVMNSILPGWLKEKIINNKYYEPQNTKHMKQLSYWARDNKWKARIIIIISWILLTLLGIYIGTSFTSLGFQMSRTVLVVLIASFLVSVFLYPFHKKRAEKKNGSSYYRQKTFDLILAICSFGMATYVANDPDVLFQQGGDVLYAASVLPPSLPKDSASTTKTYKTIAEFSKSLNDENGKPLKWKEKKKLLKKQAKAIRASKDLSKGEKFLLTFLACLAAAGLLYLVSALSCSLSCAGSEAAAIIVGIGGLGLVIFLLVITIRGIHGKSKKKQKEQLDSMIKPASN